MTFAQFAFYWAVCEGIFLVLYSGVNIAGAAWWQSRSEKKLGKTGPL